MKVLFFVITFLLVLDSFAKSSKPVGGTYLYVKNGRNQYVGATNDLNRRNTEHKRYDAYAKGNFQYIKNSMPGATANERYKQEKKDILKYKPIHNKYAGGNCSR
jgi:hypothetical protein